MAQYMEQFSAIQPEWIWFILAALLAIGEIIIVPGVFLIFIAMAAAATGVILLFTDIALPMQLFLFGIFAIIAVYLGRFIYSKQKHESPDPLLNDREARMAGQMAVVIAATSASGGRVRVGDSEWPARGPEFEVGTPVRITHVAGGQVHVESAD
jgi:inner membrane protein